jgi:hypothetical protein
VVAAVPCGFLENDNRALIFHDCWPTKIKKPLLRLLLLARGMPVPIL